MAKKKPPKRRAARRPPPPTPPQPTRPRLTDEELERLRLPQAVLEGQEQLRELERVLRLQRAEGEPSPFLQAIAGPGSFAAEMFAFAEKHRAVKEAKLILEEAENADILRRAAALTARAARQAAPKLTARRSRPSATGHPPPQRIARSANSTGFRRGRSVGPRRSFPPRNKRPHPAPGGAPGVPHLPAPPRLGFHCEA